MSQDSGVVSPVDIFVYYDCALLVLIREIRREKVTLLPMSLLPREKVGAGPGMLCLETPVESVLSVRGREGPSYVRDGRQAAI